MHKFRDDYILKWYMLFLFLFYLFIIFLMFLSYIQNSCLMTIFLIDICFFFKFMGYIQNSYLMRFVFLSSIVITIILWNLFCETFFLIIEWKAKNYLKSEYFVHSGRLMIFILFCFEEWKLRNLKEDVLAFNIVN